MYDEALIRVDKVYRYYGSRCALEDVTFNASKGEITGFLGPNGAGKSTLMQIICGVLAYSSGSVSIAGHDILESPLEAKKYLGYLPEHPPLYSECTVDEYLRYSARLRGVASDDVDNKVNVSKEQCGLMETGKRILGNLSKGYQQRVGVAQAIVHGPQLLVLDEPSSGLDPNQMIEMRELIRDIGKQHCVILSTHILAEARSICDRILILNMGKIIFNKPLDALSGKETSQIQMIVGFSNPPASMNIIKSIAGVTDVADLGHNRFRVTGDKQILTRSLTNAASSNEWGLIELGNENDSLEQIYVQLINDAHRDKRTEHDN